MNQDWTKSSYCTTAANCVEVRGTSAQVAVRDSKDTGRQPLDFGADAWRGFVTGLTSVS